MNDVRLLLKEKADIETAMQRADPLMRLVMQRQRDVVCGEIEKAREEWNKLFEQQGINQLKQRVTELEASNKELLEALEYLFGQCEENERNNTNFMGTSMFAREQAAKAIQKARGQG